MGARRNKRIGLWMVGAGGNVAATVALAVAALRRTLIEPIGLVTARPEFEGLGLVDPGDFVVGGHEIREGSLLTRVRALHDSSGVFSRDMIARCAGSLRQMQKSVRPGVRRKGNRLMIDGRPARDVQTAADAVGRLADDLRSFRERNRLAHVVVVNLASSEPTARLSRLPKTWSAFQKRLAARGAPVLPASTVYALAAFSADCSYVNFTPSIGMRWPAVVEFAESRDVRYMGSDGKTGETLVKSALAPMFAARNLAVRTWISHNVLGNDDGETLADPDAKASKLASKNRSVSRLLGPLVDARTTIEFFPSLGDWKTAWDSIRFDGLFGTAMSLQFTWQGCDSVLAAPLVLDLARLTALEFTRGRRGRMDHLAFFFKDPDGVSEYGLDRQWRILLGHLGIEEASTP